MTNKITRSNLLSIQKHLDRKKFSSGNTVSIGGIKKKVIRHVEKMYQYLHEAAIDPEKSHSSACKILRTLSHAENNKSIFRSRSDQEFYKSMSISHNKIFNVDLKESLNKMNKFVDDHYPNIKKAPFAVERIKEILTHAKENSFTPQIIWNDIKKIMDICYNQNKAFFVNHKQKIFYNNICELIVFKNNKRAPSIDEVKEEHQFQKEAQEISEAIKKEQKNRFFNRNENIIEVEYKPKSKPKC